MIENNGNCTKFDETFLEVLDKSVRLKRKLLRENQAPYFSKSLRPGILP